MAPDGQVWEVPAFPCPKVVVGADYAEIDGERIPLGDDEADPRSAARSYTVDTTGHGDNGWVAPLDSQTMYVFMTRTGTATPWQVARVSFSGGS